VNNETILLYRVVRLLGSNPRVICVKETLRADRQHEIMIGALKLVESQKMCQ